MKTVRGDLIHLAVGGQFDVIVHGCNCQGVMGAGIAKSIREAFPEAYAADQATPKGDRGKLGAISFAKITRTATPFTVVNGYTQFHYRGRNNADYTAIRSVMQAVRSAYTGLRIGYPLIGAGLAGGDWQVIARIIDEELDGEDHTLVEYQP